MVLKVTWSETPSASSRKRMIQEVRYGHSSVRLIQDASRSQLKMIWLALRRRPIKTYDSICLPLYICKRITLVFYTQCGRLRMYLTIMRWGRPVTETMLSSLLMVWGLMSLNQSSVTSSLVRSKDICRVTVRCICLLRYVSYKTMCRKDINKL